ncbi:recombinase zinc beta ribbon domain-containing protein [Paenibacillus sp. alder61]|nr:recombinase zinc beta ribbon domain-containing protein [Paenibacillus sp. alder61]
MSRSQVKGTVYYFCRTYKNQSKSACTEHSIKHNRLGAAVLLCHSTTGISCGTLC